MTVLCKAVNTKGVTFEGGSRRRSEGGPAEEPVSVHEQVQDEVGEKDAVEKTTPKSDKM